MNGARRAVRPALGPARAARGEGEGHDVAAVVCKEERIAKDFGARDRPRLCDAPDDLEVALAERQDGAAAAGGVGVGAGGDEDHGLGDGVDLRGRLRAVVGDARHCPAPEELACKRGVRRERIAAAFCTLTGLLEATDKPTRACFAAERVLRTGTRSSLSRSAREVRRCSCGGCMQACQQALRKQCGQARTRGRVHGDHAAGAVAHAIDVAGLVDDAIACDGPVLARVTVYAKLDLAGLP